MALNRFFPNFVFKGFYIASSFWIGLAINLIMTFAFTWIIFLILLLIKRFVTFDLHMFRFSIASIAVAFALLLTAIGSWRARYPVIKDLQISFKNLPSSWKGKKVVQLSDVHLGIINDPSFLEQIVSRVNAVNPDLILITGDLFDGSCSSFDEFLPSLKKFKSTYGTFFVTGNHEGYLGFERPLQTIKDANIRNLDNEIVNILGLQIIGIGYPEYRLQQNNLNNNDVLRLFKESYDILKPSILMFHTPTNIKENHKDLSSQQMNTYFKPDTSYNFAKKMKIDLQLSGHAHAGQIFPFNYISNYLFNGFDSSLHEFDDFKIYITSGTGTWGPPLRTWGQSEIVVITLSE